MRRAAPLPGVAPRFTAASTSGREKSWKFNRTSAAMSGSRSGRAFEQARRKGRRREVKRVLGSRPVRRRPPVGAASPQGAEQSAGSASLRSQVVGRLTMAGYACTAWAPLVAYGVPVSRRLRVVRRCGEGGGGASKRWRRSNAIWGDGRIRVSALQAQGLLKRADRSYAMCRIAGFSWSSGDVRCSGVSGGRAGQKGPSRLVVEASENSDQRRFASEEPSDLSA